MLSVLGNGYLIASLQSKEDYYYALEGGPWLIQNHYLTVQTWKNNFNPWNETLRKLAVWVRLPGLPIDYYDKKFFFNLGNKIGTAIEVDEMTLNKARTMYARMCVEIDLSTPLLPAYIVDGNKLKIEYEGINLICFHCGRIGHNLEHCPVKKNQEQKEGGVGSDVGKNTGNMGMAGKIGEEGREKFGEWMKAQDSRKGKRVYQKKGEAGPGQKNDAKV